MILKLIKSILFCSTLVTFSSCKGQDNAQVNENSSLTVDEIVLKLDNNIWVIYQDQKDNYWFGSNGKGIFHYDCKNLKQFTTKDGLINNSIRGIQEDLSGNVYIETPAGVSKYDGKTFTTLTPIISPNNEWKLEDDDMWFNCNGNPTDVYRYDGENLYELKLPRVNMMKAFGINTEGLSYSAYTIYGVDKDKSGNIWFGTVIAGAYRFDGESFLWVGERELSRRLDESEPGVRSILEDKNGYIWLSNFISKYKIVADSSTQYRKLPGMDPSNEFLKGKLPYFNSGLTDNNNDLWMTTYGGGVWKYDGEILSNYPVMDGETEALLISIYQDNQGILWLGTQHSGVYKYNGSGFEKFEP